MAASISGGDLLQDCAIVGTADYVADQLISSDHARFEDKDVLAFYVPRLQLRERNLLVETAERAIALIYDNLAHVQEVQLKQLVDFLTPRVPPPTSIIREAQMVAKARTAVLKSAVWLTATDIARNRGSKSSNPNALTSKWKRDKKIFVITPSDGTERFPAYGLDADYKPYAALAEIIKILGDKAGWGLAYWFGSSNSFLSGQSPQELLGSEPDRVVAAAKIEAEGIQHG